jgi:hypothetical protein
MSLGSGGLGVLELGFKSARPWSTALLDAGTIRSKFSKCAWFIMAILPYILFCMSWC